MTSEVDGGGDDAWEWVDERVSGNGKEELGIPVLSTSPYERCSVLPRVPEKETRLPVEKMYIGGSHLPSKNHPPPPHLEKKEKKASSYFLFMFSLPSAL